MDFYKHSVQALEVIDTKALTRGQGSPNDWLLCTFGHILETHHMSASLALCTSHVLKMVDFCSVDLISYFMLWKNVFGEKNMTDEF